jgi:hypothetical protein
VERDAVERRPGLRIERLVDLDAVGLFEPTSCSAMMCAATSPSSTSGTATTCSAKKRFSVASDTL